MESVAGLLGLARALTMTNQPDRAIELVATKAVSESLSHEARGMAHSILGMAYKDQGEFPIAIQHFLLSLDHRQKCGDRRGEAASLTNLASAYGRVGRIDQASTFLDLAVRLSREIGDREYESYAVGWMGSLQLMRGDPRAALGFFRESLAIESTREDHGILASRLNSMAHANVLLGLLDDGLMYLSEADKHIALSGQRQERAYSSYLKGLIYAARGTFEGSDGAFLEAIEIYREDMMPHQVAKAKGALAETQCARGDYQSAERSLREASDDLKNLNFNLALAKNEVLEASLAISQGAFPDAKAALARANGHLNGSPFWETNVRSLLIRGELFLARSSFHSAVEKLTLAVTASVKSGFKELEVLARTRLGESLTFLGELRKARSSLDAALETSKRLGFRYVRATATLAMANLNYRSDDLESAVSASTDAIALAKLMSLRPVLFRGFVTLGDSLFRLGRIQKAQAAYREAYEVHQELLARTFPFRRISYRETPEIRDCLRRISAGSL